MLPMYQRNRAARNASGRSTRGRHAHSGEIYRWEFEKGRKSLSVAVNGPLIVDDVALAIRPALDDIFLVFLEEDNVKQHLATGRLIRILADWCQPESTMLALRGHMSRAMLERYSHIRFAAKREGLAGIRLLELQFVPDSEPLSVEVPVVTGSTTIQ